MNESDGKHRIWPRQGGIGDTITVECGGEDCYVCWLENSHDQLVEALKYHLAESYTTLREAGGCDHGVGICWCELERKIHEAEDILEAAGEKLPYPNGKPCPECGWLSGHHDVGCKAAGEVIE